MADLIASAPLLPEQIENDVELTKGNKEKTGPVEDEYDFAFRIILVGDSGVGKSSLVYKELSKQCDWF